MYLYTLLRCSANLPNALLVAIVAQLTAGCSGQREPAKLALEKIHTEMEMASPDAPKYLPDQAIFVKKEVARLNASFEVHDYSTVVADSPTVLLDAKHLVAAATSRNQEAVLFLMHEWTTLDSSLPPSFAAVRSRLDALSNVRHAPKGVDTAAAKATVAEGRAFWDQGHAAFDAGRIEEAVASLKNAKPKVDAAAAALQLQLSTAN